MRVSEGDKNLLFGGDSGEHSDVGQKLLKPPSTIKIQYIRHRLQSIETDMVLHKHRIQKNKQKQTSMQTTMELLVTCPVRQRSKVFPSCLGKVSMAAVVPPPMLCQSHASSLISVRTRVFLVAILSSLATWQAVSGLSPVNMMTCTKREAAASQILGSIVVSTSPPVTRKTRVRFPAGELLFRVSFHF